MDCEAWRKETKLDELLPTWDYPEKKEVFNYYPQYYHGTDKVGEYFAFLTLVYPPDTKGMLTFGFLE